MHMHPTLLVLVVWSCAFVSADPVCIVGAGPAGLTIANRLQAKGLETVIFEKNPEVGGKCQAFYDDKGLFHPMGALLYSNETYRETLPIIEAAGVPSAPFGYTSKLWLYDWRTGHVEEGFMFSSLTQNSLFKAEIDKYTKFWNTKFASKATIGYKNGVEGYTMSTFDWLVGNGYPLLLLLFVNGMVPYGYGDITKTPALYMLTYLTPDLLLFFAGQRLGYVIDFHQVFLRYASTIRGPIYLNASITKIDRSGDRPVITYLGNATNTPTAQNCSKLVLAFPPVMHALQAANLDISGDERAVFSPVGITKYWSGAVRVATPNGAAFAGFLRGTFLGLITRLLGKDIFPFGEFIPWLPEAAGQPVAMLRLFNESDIATTYSWGKYRSNQTLSQAKALLKQTLSKINKDPRDTNAKPKQITDDDVKDFREWDYFPHYDRSQLDQGYYSKFNQLQGNKNTFYVSGFNGFETVEFAIRAGIDIADTFFASSNSTSTSSAASRAASTSSVASTNSTASSSTPTASSGATERLGIMVSSLVIVFACAIGLGLPGLFWV